MTEKQKLAAAVQDCMAYLPGMEVIESDILRETAWILMLLRSGT